MLATEQFPELEMRPPNYAKGTTWVGYRPADFPVRVRIDLKGDRGIVDLTFSGVEHPILDDAKTRLGLPGSVHKTGRSSAIRQHSGPFTVGPDFDAVKEVVRDAFCKCVAAIELFRKHRTELSRLVSD